MSGADLLTLALLGLVTIAVYASVRTHGLLYEDPAWLLGTARPRWFFAARLGASPSALHLGNLAVHLVNGGLVYALARRAGLTRAALLAAFIFWLHPIQRVPVNLIAGRPDLLLTTGILVAVLAASLALRGSAAPAHAVGLVALAVGALAVAFVIKASGVVGLGLVAVTAVILDDRAPLMHALGWIGLTLGTVLITIWSPVQLATFLQPTIYNLLAFAGRQAVVVWRLLALVIVPLGFSVDHDYAGVPFSMGLLALAGLSAAIRWCWGQRVAQPVVAWAGLWILIAIAPRFLSLGIYPGVGPDITEAQWYPAMPGVAIGAATLLKGLVA